jgi:hypothetical protein
MPIYTPANTLYCFALDSHLVITLTNFQRQRTRQLNAVHVENLIIGAALDRIISAQMNHSVLG